MLKGGPWDVGNGEGTRGNGLNRAVRTLAMICERCLSRKKESGKNGWWVRTDETVDTGEQGTHLGGDGALRNFDGGGLKG